MVSRLAVGSSAPAAGIRSETLASIPSFGGHQEKARSWVSALDSVQALYNISDGGMLEAARAKLTAGARAWYENRADTISSWAELRAAVIGMYVPQEDIVALSQALVKRVQ